MHFIKEGSIIKVLLTSQDILTVQNCIKQKEGNFTGVGFVLADVLKKTEIIKHYYKIKKIATAVKKAGGENIHIEPAYGWSNQPEVVGFESTEEMVKDIAAKVSRMLDIEWVHILEKEW